MITMMLDSSSSGAFSLPMLCSVRPNYTMIAVLRPITYNNKTHRPAMLACIHYM